MHIVSRLYLISLILVLSGCALVEARKIETSSFLPYGDALVERLERAPFHGLWVRDLEQQGPIADNYSSVLILPINYQIPLEQLIVAKNLPPRLKRIRQDEISEMARYAREVFYRELTDRGSQLRRADDLDEDTLLVELAIVEIQPTNVPVNVAGTVAGFFVPGGGVLSAAGGSGSIAIEGVVRDGNSGRAMLLFKDRAIDKSSLFSVRDFQQYAHIRQAIDSWAREVSELLATPVNHKVEGELPVTLNPF